MRVPDGISESLEIGLDLLGHQLAPLVQEVIEGWDLSVQHALRQAAHPKIGPHLLNRRDATILLGAAVALVRQLAEVNLRVAVTDANVNLALGQDEVGDLVVAAASETLALEVLRG